MGARGETQRNRPALAERMSKEVWHPYETLRRTRMRTPVVKRQTTPCERFFAFFPLSRAWRSQQTGVCSDLISV
jgi:hypothetical protein